jgi:hypothetical protein
VFYKKKKFLDEVIMFSHESDDDFMERWRRKYLPDMDTISSDTEKDTPPDPIKELEEIILNMHYAHTKQLEAMQLAHAKQFEAMNLQLDIMEARLAEDETYIEYPDPHELELDNEKEFGEVHVETSDESIDEPVIYFDEVKELEFENVEYLDDLSSHPPPDEPIILKDNFENLEESSMMVPMMCSSSASQPKDLLMQNYVELEGSFSLSMSYHYEYWLASHLDSHEQQSSQILHRLVIFQCLVERKKDVGTWLVLPYKKFQVDQTWEGVFCESSWTRIIQTPMASFHPFHGWL